VQNPVKGQQNFLDAINMISGLIRRFDKVEDAYRIEEANSLLQDAIINLYRRILILQGKALQYLAHHQARRILSDTFKPEQWKDEILNIKKQEEECNKILTDKMREALKTQSKKIEDIREEVTKLFKQSLAGIQVQCTYLRHLMVLIPSCRSFRL
jgi:hypothetical protein